MSTSQMLDIYLLNVGRKNMKFWKCQIYPKIRVHTEWVKMLYWEKVNTNKQIYIYIYIYVYVYVYAYVYVYVCIYTH